jgi:hypothetical protein
MNRKAESKAEITYGMLQTHTVELPYEDAEAAKRAEEMNNEIAGLGRVFRGATDFGFVDYQDTATAILQKNPMTKYIPSHTQPFQKGDLVKVFSTITDGDVQWDGVIDYDRTNYHHGFQKEMSPRDWATMFYDELPAKLERDGKVIFGALQAFAETGTEGDIWSVFEYGKNGYEGLNCLQDGDKLTVYNMVRDGAVTWEGAVDFGDTQVHKQDHLELMRHANHMDTKDWLYMSFGRHPVMITPRQGLKAL